MRGSVTINVQTPDGAHEANVRMIIDAEGKAYALVRIEGLTARHYPRKFGIPLAAGSWPQGSEACMFLEGEPCWIV